MLIETNDLFPWLVAGTCVVTNVACSELQYCWKGEIKAIAQCLPSVCYPLLRA